LQFALPLFDSYPGHARAKNMDNPRLSPVVAKAETLPDDIMLIIPTMDILLHEQLTFAKRIEEEARPGQKIVTKKFEKMFHGWDKREYHSARLDFDFDNASPGGSGWSHEV
jgi:acetyl esterase/lipase